MGLATLLEYNLKKVHVAPTIFDLKTLKNWILEKNIKQSELTIYLDPDRRANQSRTFAPLKRVHPNLIEIQK